MKEAAVEMPVVRQAEAEGFYTRKVGWVGRRSAPDRIFSRADRGVVFIEFKRPGERATLAQQQEHQRMRAAGMEVHVCDSIDEARRILRIGPYSEDALETMI